MVDKGKVAAAVIGAILLFGLIGFVVYWLYIKKSKIGDVCGKVYDHKCGTGLICGTTGTCVKSCATNTDCASLTGTTCQVDSKGNNVCQVAPVNVVTDITSIDLSATVPGSCASGYEETTVQINAAGYGDDVRFCVKKAPMTSGMTGVTGLTFALTGACPSGSTQLSTPVNAGVAGVVSATALYPCLAQGTTSLLSDIDVVDMTNLTLSSTGNGAGCASGYVTGATNLSTGTDDRVVKTCSQTI